MTNEELKKNWKQYALKLLDGQTVVMRKVYILVAVGGEYKGGLLFEMKEPKGLLDLLRADKNNFCYTKVAVNGEFLDFWVPIGKFVKLGTTEKKERRAKEKKK